MFLARYVQPSRYRSAAGYQDSVELSAYLTEFHSIDICPSGEADSRFLQNPVILVNDFALQSEFRNSVSQYASRSFVLVENRDSAAFFPQFQRGRDACRTSADDGDFLSVVNAGTRMHFLQIGYGDLRFDAVPVDRHFSRIQYAMPVTAFIPVTYEARDC